MSSHSAGPDLPPAHLVQLLFPVRKGHEEADRRSLDKLREELTERFGGVTAFLRSPAIGDWKDDSDRVERDEIVIVEVMADTLDREWWAEFRESVRKQLDQEELIVRALPYILL